MSLEIPNIEIKRLDPDDGNGLPVFAHGYAVPGQDITFRLAQSEIDRVELEFYDRIDGSLIEPFLDAQSSVSLNPEPTGPTSVTLQLKEDENLEIFIKVNRPPGSQDWLKLAVGSSAEEQPTIVLEFFEDRGVFPSSRLIVDYSRGQFIHRPSIIAEQRYFRAVDYAYCTQVRVEDAQRIFSFRIQENETGNLPIPGVRYEYGGQEYLLVYMKELKRTPDPRLVLQNGGTDEVMIYIPPDGIVYEDNFGR